MFAQSGWFAQSSGTSQTLYGVCFTDAKNGTVVGQNTILRTTDGGVSWINRYQNSYPETISGVYFIDANHGIVVGAWNWYGYMNRTTDGGLSWMGDYAHGIDLVQAINAVCFSDDSVGTFVGEFGSTGIYNGFIYRTYNGGTTWTLQRGSNHDLPILEDVSFIDANIGTVVGSWYKGYGSIYHTTNNGTNWAEQTTGTTTRLNGVCLTNANTAIVVGDSGTILRTTNGGGIWTKQSSGTSNYLLGVSFPNIDTGFVVGGNGTILRTIDGGVHWTAQLSGTTSTLRRVCFTTGRTGTVVGDNGTILRTTTGGLVGVKHDNILDMPYQFQLFQNYPNPFNPMTTIRFSIPKAGIVSLIVYNILGEIVTQLVDSHREQGTYTEVWNATTLSSGVYFYRLEYDRNVLIKRMLLMK